MPDGAQEPSNIPFDCSEKVVWVLVLFYFFSVYNFVEQVELFHLGKISVYLQAKREVELVFVAKCQIVGDRTDLFTTLLTRGSGAQFPPLGLKARGREGEHSVGQS